jgi:MFS family permease
LRTATQGENSIGPSNRPEHAGLLETGDDDGFAAHLDSAGLWTAVTVLGMAVGIWTFGQLADRLGRKPVFVLFQIAAMVMVFVYSRITDPTTLLWAGAIMGFA